MVPSTEGYTGGNPGKEMKIVRRLKDMGYKKRLRESGLLDLKKTRWKERGNLSAVYSFLM